MMIDSYDSILDRKDYEAALAEVEKSNPKETLTATEYQAFLTDYIHLIEQRDRGYPLLLKNGESLQLKSKPLTLHLLPPFANKTKRWVLATYLSAGVLKIQLICWTLPPDSSEPAELKTLAETSLSDISPLKLHCTSVNLMPMGERCFIALAFAEGQLDIISSTDGQFIATTWSDQLVEDKPRIERHSWKDMQEVVRIRRNTRGHWRNDSLFDSKDNKLSSSKPLKLGWVRAVDSPEDNPQRIYLATNQAKITVLERQAKDSNKIASIAFLPEPEPLEGKTLDVLVLKVPYKSEGHAILVSTDNGLVYLLIPNISEADKELGIKSSYVQLVEPRISHCIGFGGQDILALDALNQLSPLSLTNPEKFWKIRDEATKKLTDYYFKLSSIGNSDNPAELLKPEQYRLFLEFFLYSLSHVKSSADIDTTKKLKFFFESYTLLQEQVRLEASESSQYLTLQSQLITRFFMWLKRSTIHEKLTFDTPDKQTLLSYIWKLIKPDSNAPDDLWLPLLRKSARLRLWATNNKVIQNSPEFELQLSDWEEYLQRVRGSFATGLKQARYLNTCNHYLLKSHCDDLVILDELTGTVAALEYASGLRIFKINEQQWQLQKSPDIACKGRFHFIHRLPNSLDKGAKVYFILGSDKGDLCLMSFELHTQAIKIEHKISIGTTNLLCCLNIPEQNGLLLGGYNVEESAILYGWSYIKIFQGLKPSILWEDNNKTQTSTGRLRQLSASGDGKTLWGMDNQKGRLYRWPIIPNLFGKNKQLTDQPTILLQTDCKLSALDYSATQNLLLCGSENGAVYAIDTLSGHCAWSVVCAGKLRWVVFMRDYPVQEKPTGAWLLCGSEKSSLVVDQQGNILSVLEQIGPICASVSYQGQQKIILGTLNGRLMLMDYSQPKTQSDLDLWDDPLLYPVRCLNPPLNTASILQVLQKTCPDSQTNSAILHLFITYLQQAQQAIDSNLQAAFFSFWDDQSLARKVFLLYRLRASCLANSSLQQHQEVFILSLLENTWQGFAEAAAATSQSGLACKLISPVMDLLNMSTTTAAKNLRVTINKAIWQSPLQDNSLLVSKETLIAIRWNQLIKCWRASISTNQLGTAEQLFTWCNSLAAECLAENAQDLRLCLEDFPSFQLQNLLQSSDCSRWLLPLLQSSQSKSNYFIAFQSLEKPRTDAYPAQEFQALYDLLSDNSFWQNWLSNLQLQLTTLAKKRQQIPLIAWQELQAWAGLAEHILAQGKHIFSVQQQQSMLALWWSRLVLKWQHFIQTQLRELDKKIRLSPEKYLSISMTDLWESQYQVQLDISLKNLFHKNLHINMVHYSVPDTTMELQCITGLPLTLPASDALILLQIKLKANTANQLQGHLQLNCRLSGDHGASIDINIPLDKQRQLLHLSENPIWLASWKKLTDLLEQWDQQQQAFYWLEGDLWSEKEREQLYTRARDKYGFDIPAAQLSLDKLTATDCQLFSPDLALGAPAELLLEQLHALLASSSNINSSYWALEIWHLARPLPDSIAQALTELLPQITVVSGLLTHLLGESLAKQLVDSITQLPASALGAWCGKEPFYTPKDQALSDIYLNSSCLLPKQIWTSIDQAAVSITDIAKFLGVAEQQAKQEQTARTLFSHASLALFDQTKSYQQDEQVIKLFFESLGASQLNYASSLWWAPLDITLNWQDYSLCCVLPHCSAKQRQEMLELIQQQRPKDLPLWLCLGETEAPADLNYFISNVENEKQEKLSSLALAVSLDDMQALMQVRQPSEASHLLNQMMARDHGLHSHHVFSSAGGMGSRVGKHFGGRETELALLSACLNEADKKGAGALIIGGRRIGKTSLRERLLFDIKQTQAERVCLVFNFEGEGKDRERTGIELEYWFFQLLEEKFLALGQPFEDNWSKSFKGNIDKRNQARVLLRKHLQQLKSKTGYVPLFLLDETEHLVRWDTRDPKQRWSLFSLLRKLTQEGYICFIATSYPHGLGNVDSLNIANHSSATPLYNTFAYKIQLEPWEPTISWDYIKSRLAGLGVLLPLRYQVELLAISRGIPWIIQEFGLGICQALPKGEKVVYPNTWEQVKKHVLQEIHNSLKVSVTELSNKMSLKYQQQALLEQGQLWQALCDLAAEANTVLSKAESDWGTPWKFSTAQLQDRLVLQADILADILQWLSSSPIIEGLTSETDQFVFANNLLPMWLHYTQER